MKALFIPLVVLCLACSTKTASESPVDQLIAEVEKIHGPFTEVATFPNGETLYYYRLTESEALEKTPKIRNLAEKTLNELPTEVKEGESIVIGSEMIAYFFLVAKWETVNYKLTLESEKNIKKDSVFVKLFVNRKAVK